MAQVPLYTPPFLTGAVLSGLWLRYAGRSALMVAYATLVGCASLLSACIPLPRGYSVSPKSVAAKSGTHTLLADDGSTCKVSEKVFAEIDIGDVKTCTWGPAGESAGAGTPAGVQRGRRPPITSKPPR